MSPRRHVFAILVASLVLTATLGPSAQPVPSEVWTAYVDLRTKGRIFRETRELLVKAQAEERAGRRDEALELYAQAFDLDPFSVVEAEYGLALIRSHLDASPEGCRAMTESPSRERA